MPTVNSHLVVIGGTSGLGLEIAKAAHASGIKVTIGGRGAERAAETAKSIGPNVTGVHIDLGDLPSIRRALRDGPPIDHLVITPIMRLSTTVKDFAIAEAEQLRPYQARRLCRNSQRRAAAAQTEFINRVVLGRRQNQSLCGIDHDLGGQRRHCWHDQDHGDGARANPGQLHLTRPRTRLADLEARAGAGAQSGGRCDDRKDADTPAGDDRGRHPGRFLPARQQGRERHRLGA